MSRFRARHAASALVGLFAPFVAAGTALAHHPMGGETPRTLWHGLLSGLGHPVIGPDHLAFIVAIGIAAGLLRDRGGLIATFIAASTAGVIVHVGKLGVPMVEPLVALTVVAAGAILALGGTKARPAWLALAAISGALHGYAFGEAVVGAERGVIGAYLMGIAIVAFLIAGTFAYLTQRFADIEIGHMVRVRMAGITLGCIGVVMLVGSLVAT
jgi:urease accessory protein